jgi:hypothetical protein
MMSSLGLSVIISVNGNDHDLQVFFLENRAYTLRFVVFSIPVAVEGILRSALKALRRQSDRFPFRLADSVCHLLQRESSTDRIPLSMF